MKYPDEDFEITEHKVIEEIPWSETCFGCNNGPNEGMGVRAYRTEDGRIVGLSHTKTCHQGYPGTIHGGLVATYFDEVLWHATRMEDPDTVAMTVEMNVKYYRPIVPQIDIRIVAEKARFEGRHIYVEGRILLPDDKVAATASVHYLILKQEAHLNVDERTRVKHRREIKEFSVWF